MSHIVQDAYWKTHDKDGPVIHKLTLPAIDVKDAITRFPHEWSLTVDGHAAAPPAAVVAAGAGAVGPSGGNPMLIGGVGIKESIRPAAKHKGSAAAA